ncbi:alkyl/aryl-sulfatase [Krasilnikovia sp. MM14-A1259]|uniref:alkyl/aryl-sulfatase n=1 Tax=Krasilnikovia sp. MM14-A1259 TaxID=3373539 RepID=UPI003829CB91
MITETASAGPKDAQPSTRARNEAMLALLPFSDRQDFEDVSRGLVEAASTEAIRRPNGFPIWDLGAYSFQDAPTAPATVNPSLWRQAQLNRVAGLFEVTDRVYQLRGMDISNITVVEGDTGIIVIDPFISTETATAAMDLYRRHRGDRRVVAVIYTHSHVDHYGGVRALVSDDDITSGRVKIYAPSGFLENAVSENVFAGTAMSRRSHFQYGIFLPRNERGQVDIGLGKAVSSGTITLIPPTDLIDKTGTRLTIDGVDLEFQMTPGTEAPAEMNFYFPQFRALCAAENATHTLHNLLTLRGAEVRDAKAWSAYLNETIDLFADRTDVVFASHHWPVWGSDRIRGYLEDIRDAYQYLHDQTLRLINHGLTPMEIAETLTELPPGLADKWYLRGYYGSISHGVRAIYQRYLGFYDGNPAHLNPHQPTEAGRRYVDLAGGPDALLDKARAAYADGDYRWVAELVDHLVFTDPTNTAARELQADALEQLGYQCENGTWRSLYLSGAHELRNGVFHGVELTVATPDTIRAMSLDLYFDYLGIRLNADKAAKLPTRTLNWEFTDTDQTYAVTVRHAALTYRAGRGLPDPDATITLTRALLDQISIGDTTFEQAINNGALRIDGDPAALTELLGCLDEFHVMFNIVEP